MRTHRESSPAASRLDTSKGVLCDSRPLSDLAREDVSCLTMPRFCLMCGAVLGSDFHGCFSSFFVPAGGPSKPSRDPSEKAFWASVLASRDRKSLSSASFWPVQEGRNSFVFFKGFEPLPVSFRPAI